jgi:hypothetical protein
MDDAVSTASEEITNATMINATIVSKTTAAAM